MADLSKMTNSLKNIGKLAKGFEKGEPFLEELDAKLAALEERLLQGLENDERIKAQKKAS